jgi:hypothetical protein
MRRMLVPNRTRLPLNSGVGRPPSPDVENRIACSRSGYEGTLQPAVLTDELWS